MNAFCTGNAVRSGEIPAPHPACRITVVIPARNESASIGQALAALTAQRDLAGRPLTRALFDVIVFANNCSDATAAIVHECATAAPHVPIFVVEGDLCAADSHIGAARKFVMDLAAARFLAAGMPHGIVASTDSDTLVDAQWIAWTLREAAGVDAVAGHVAIADTDQYRLLAPVRLLYARELTYRRLVAEAEARIDPLPEDPLPRHSSFVGASFAVTAQTYFAAGSLPPLRCLEDYYFCRALRRIDARIRHSPYVRATTSARTHARVDGGFGSFIAGLHSCADRGETFHVEHPRQTLDAFELRAALRGMWSAGLPSLDPGDGSPRLLRALRRTSPDWATLRAASPTFGSFYERVSAFIAPEALPPAHVERAIEVLREATMLRVAADTFTRDLTSSSA